MPRKGPPEGCVHYQTAVQMLIDAGVIQTGTMIYKIWENYGLTTAKLSDVLSPREKEKTKTKTRERGFYRLSDIKMVIEKENMFRKIGLTGTWKSNPSTVFRQAIAEDLPAILDMSLKIFCEPPTLETRLRWLREEPESLFVLTNHDGTILGYSSIIAVEERAMHAFAHGLTDSSTMVAQRFVPGPPLHLYVMALAIDPVYIRTQKHTYGAALLRGVIGFLFALAERGVDIETITARSNKPDGIRLLKELSIPQIKSPVPDKKLFYLKVSDSGHEVFEQYRFLRYNGMHE